MLRDGADEADRLRLPANCGRFRQKGCRFTRRTGNAIANANRKTSRRRQERLHKARCALGRTRAAAAGEYGAAMSLATAAEYALMLTDPGPPRSAPGPGELSARERELVTLVAQGRTNAQIAVELHISVPHDQLAPGPDPGQDRLPLPLHRREAGGRR